MKLLFLSSWFPYPPDNGSRLRAFHLLRALAVRHDLTLVSLTDDDYHEANSGYLAPFVREVETYPRPPYQPGRFRALAALASPRPRYIVDTFDPALDDSIRRIASRGNFDAVIAAQLSMAVYAAPLNHPVKIFDEAEAGLFADGLQRGGTARRLRAALTWSKYARYLRGLAAHFRALTAVSSAEAQLLGAVGISPRKIHVIPNGVDCQAVPATPPAVEPYSLIYPGALTFSANLDAMRYFVGEILPRIQSKEPRAHLRITGRAPQVAINELSGDNAVLFTGYVEDVRPMVRSSAVCVVPLRTGGGTRLKILEAMAAGTPVVATSKGAEGLQVENGTHLLIADDPAAFAEATVRLLSDPPLRARLVQAARERVCARYNWQDIGEQLEHLIQDAVKDSQEV